MFGSTLVAGPKPPISAGSGIETLAGIALVFPFVMLTQMMSAAAMGGRCLLRDQPPLGAGNRDRAATARAARGQSSAPAAEFS